MQTTEFASTAKTHRVQIRILATFHIHQTSMIIATLPWFPAGTFVFPSAVTPLARSLCDKEFECGPGIQLGVYGHVPSHSIRGIDYLHAGVASEPGPALCLLDLANLFWLNLVAVRGYRGLAANSLLKASLFL